jgi:hypothetical protein
VGRVEAVAARALLEHARPELRGVDDVRVFETDREWEALDTRTRIRTRMRIISRKDQEKSAGSSEAQFA